MAWSIPTYAGTYMGGSPSAARVALFELCRAVNERQGALAITKTQFYKADGTLAADVASADFAGIQASGTNALAFRNLKRVRDAIISMVNAGYFVVSSGQSTAWTKAALETAIGNDLDANPLRPQEARYWQAMQDALDLLIYARRESPFILSGATSYSQGYPLGGFYGFGPSESAAWVDMIAAPEVSTSTALAMNEIVRSSAGSGAFACNARSGRGTFDIEVSNGFMGTLQDLAYKLNIDVDSTFSGNCSVSVGSLVLDLLSYSGLQGAFELLAPSLDLPLGSSGTFDVEAVIPTSLPFDLPLNSGLNVADIHSPCYAVFYFDLAPVLSDQ